MFLSCDHIVIISDKIGAAFPLNRDSITTEYDDIVAIGFTWALNVAHKIKPDLNLHNRSMGIKWAFKAPGGLAGMCHGKVKKV